jgi:hypothetical protein
MHNEGQQAAGKQKKRQNIRNFKFLFGGMVVGAILCPIVLFSAGHVTTVNNAERMARESANEAEALAILPYCLASFRDSADAGANLAALQKANHWERAEFIMEGGWSTAPDGSTTGSQVANACANKLLADARTAANTTK